MSARNEDPLLVDCREASRLLSCSERTLFDLTKSGSLPVVRLGRSVRYSPEDLREWINARRSVRDTTVSDGQ